MELLFLRQEEGLDLQAQAIDAFGGLHGLRDEGALVSALLAPEPRAFYEGADLAVCAATYAFHLTQAHAFIDGNKRIAAIATELFVELNGARLDASDEAVIDLFVRIAASTIPRDEVEQVLGGWIVQPG